MALKKYIFPESGAASIDVDNCRSYYVADAEVTDRPSTAGEGELCYCKDTKKLWKWTSASIWEDAGTSGAAGTVTSVAMTAPAIFAIAGSPIVAAGTLALTLATQTANLVFAGPASGGAAAPTFRSLVAADLPAHTHAAADISSGTLDIARIPTGSTSSTVCIGNDARLSDARTPTAHTHNAADINAGTVATARLGSGTADGTTFLRGDQTWAAPAGGGGAWTTIKKTADESITNDAVLGADAVLKFTTAPNTQYHIRLRVWYQTGTTGDFKYRLTHGGTTTRVKRASVRAFSTLSANWPTALMTAFDSADITLAGTGTDGCITEDIWLQVGASGGELAFQWAQATANGTATIVLEGSYLEHATF